jgi:hypothetical protein
LLLPENSPELTAAEAAVSFLKRTTIMKANATYRAPKGESKVIETASHTFLDGKSVELTDARLINKLKGNRFFDIDVTEADPNDKDQKKNFKSADKQKEHAAVTGQPIEAESHDSPSKSESHEASKGESHSKK